MAAGTPMAFALEDAIRHNRRRSRQHAVADRRAAVADVGQSC
jgi:hypothetical protein